MSSRHEVGFGARWAGVVSLLLICGGCQHGCSADPVVLAIRLTADAAATRDEEDRASGVRLVGLEMPVDPRCSRYEKFVEKDDAEVTVPEPIGNYHADRKKMISRLSVAPETEIAVLVDASGAVGFGEEVDGKFDKDLSRLSVSASHWRRADGSVDERLLHFTDSEAVSRVELRRRMNRVKPFGVMKVRVRLDPLTVNDPGAARVEGLLVQMIESEHTDTELQAIGTALQQPLTVNDPFFGTMTLDRSVDWYAGQRTLGSGTYAVTIECEKCNDPSSVMTAANRQRLLCVESNLSRIAEFVVADLLELYNGSWSERGKLTAGGFLEKIRLTDVTLEPESIRLSFDDGGLFGGHLITISVDDKKNEVREAGIEG